MFKEWLKQFLAVVLCVATLLSPISAAQAKDYVPDDTSGDFTYYIVDGKDVDDLFDFTIYDIPNILDWVKDFKTFTVIKKYPDQNNNTKYKMYFNTPNLQSIVKNSVIGNISDGYTDDTYNVNETEWLVDVGPDTPEENAITKYGFKIPSYVYWGEYPKEVMSPAGIVPSPKKWWEVLWRAIKSLFGVSFLKAPDADNYNSIRYINHTYTDRTDYVLKFIKQYYLKYLESQIIVDRAYDLEKEEMRDYFDSPEEVMELTVTEENKKNAEKYNDKYEDEYLSALQHYVWWYKYDANQSFRGLADGSWFDRDYVDNLPNGDIDDPEADPATDLGWQIDPTSGGLFGNKWSTVEDYKVDIMPNVYGTADTYTYDGWHFIASRTRYKSMFADWLYNNLTEAYVYLNCIGDDTRGKYSSPYYDVTHLAFCRDSKNTKMTTASDYGFSVDGNGNISFDKGADDSNVISAAADIVKHSYDYLDTHFTYDEQEREETRTRRGVDTEYRDRTYLKYNIITHNADGDVAVGPYTMTVDGLYVTDLNTWYAYTHADNEGWKDYHQADISNQNPAWTANGGWTTTQADVEEDRLYKDVETWIENANNHIETPRSPDVTLGSEEYGNWQYSTSNDTYLNDEVTCGTSIGWSNFSFTFDSIDTNKSQSIKVLEAHSYRENRQRDRWAVDTQTHYRNANYKFKYYWDAQDNTKQVTDVTAFRKFREKFDFNNYDVKVKEKNGNNYENMNIDDVIHPDLQAIYKNVENNKQLIAKFLRFHRLMARGKYYEDPDKSDDTTSIQQLPYRQCMIYNTGEEGECVSELYGDGKTTITLANVIVYSGIYKITEEHRANDYQGQYATLNDSEARTLLDQLQVYCGPYYSQVLANMMKLMAATASYEGDNGPTTMIVEDDPRVMPYDIGTMVLDDKENYDVPDPRVERYKQHLIGSTIASFNGDINDLNPELGLSFIFRLGPTIISWAGVITELSVFMQSICDFEFFDNVGLSPTTFWTNNVFVSLIFMALVCFFILKTVFAVIKMGQQGLTKILIGFAVLVFELGVFTCIMIAPDSTWGTIKHVTNRLVGVGENITANNNPNVSYLFGTSDDYKVAYYLPYLDIWSKYNTGYGLLKPQQLMDSNAVELDDSFYNPKIGGNDIKHWSVLLADSFTYHGRSNSLINTIVENGQTINGKDINNNAYRVVDHFMAPRVVLTNVGSNMHVEIKQNENFNNEFQTDGAGIDLIAKLANCLIICFISLIKMCIFLYFWWKLYLFIFNVVLGLAAERKKMSTILADTFLPLLALVLFGVYAGIIMTLNMSIDGFICLCLCVFEFWLTTWIIRWWHDSSRGLMFPFTLGWLYALSSMSKVNKLRERERLENESANNATDVGIQLTQEQLTNLDARTDVFFDESGNLRTEFNTDKNGYDPTDRSKPASEQNRYGKVLDDWYRFAQNSKRNGIPLNDREIAAMRTYESDPRFREQAQRTRESVENYGRRPKTQARSSGKIKASDSTSNGQNTGAQNSSGKEGAKK